MEKINNVNKGIINIQPSIHNRNVLVET